MATGTPKPIVPSPPEVRKVLDAENGLVKWQKRDLRLGVFLTPSIFKAAANVIPLVSLQSVEQQKIIFHEGIRSRYPELTQAPDLRSVVTLTLLDKRTGQIIGQTAALPMPRRAGAKDILNVDVRSRSITVSAGSARFRFPVQQRQKVQGKQNDHLEEQPTVGKNKDR